MKGLGRERRAEILPDSRKKQICVGIAHGNGLCCDAVASNQDVHWSRSRNGRRAPPAEERAADVLLRARGGIAVRVIGQDPDAGALARGVRDDLVLLEHHPEVEYAQYDEQQEREGERELHKLSARIRAPPDDERSQYSHIVKIDPGSGLHGFQRPGAFGTHKPLELFSHVVKAFLI